VREERVAGKREGGGRREEGRMGVTGFITHIDTINS
jgi:hypothetical protein